MMLMMERDGVVKWTVASPENEVEKATAEIGESTDTD